MQWVASTLHTASEHGVSRKCVMPVVFVKTGKGMQSNRTMAIKVYLMTILDSYMFRPLLAIFRLSSSELNLRSYYTH